MLNKLKFLLVAAIVTLPAWVPAAALATKVSPA